MAGFAVFMNGRFSGVHRGLTMSTYRALPRGGVQLPGVAYLKVRVGKTVSVLNGKGTYKRNVVQS